MIRKFIGKIKKSEFIHIKSSDGNKCYSSKEISTALGESFQKKLFQFELQVNLVITRM